jgi:hypothetical protein
MHRQTPVTDGEPAAMMVSQVDTIVTLPQQRSESLTSADLLKAAGLFKTIDALPRHGTVWAALRILRKALSESMWDLRIALQWVALEALFGVDAQGELRFRLSTHLALYLGENYDERLKIAKTAKDLYGVRSKVVHGSRSAGIADDAMVSHCTSLEDLVRRAIEKILIGGQLEQFDSSDREGLFGELLFRAPK